MGMDDRILDKTNSNIKTYMGKPLLIQAIELKLENWEEIKRFCPKISYDMERRPNGKITFYIETPEGTMRSDRPSYLVKGTIGEYYAVLKEVFESKYEEV